MKKLAVFKIVIISCFTTLAVKLYVQADSGKTSGPALLDSTTGQLNSSQSPRPFVPINGPIIVSATGSKTQTYSSTSTAYQSATATFTATGSGVSAGTDTNSATGTATGTLTATTTTTGTQVLTLTGTATGTSTGTQWTAEIGNPSSGSYLFNVNNLLGVDKNGFVWFPPLGSTQLHVQQEYNAFTNGAVYTLHNPGLRINVFGSEGSAYLGGVSNAGGGDAPFSVMGFGSYLPGRIWMRGSRYGDPTQLTTTPILSIGGSVGGVPDKFRVLGNGQMYTQNMLTLQGDLVATYEVTSTSTATATYSSGNTYIVTNTTTSTASGTGPFIMGGNMTLSSTATSGGTGIGCSGTCSTGNWAQFTDSTHITNVAAPTYVSVGADAAGAAAAAVNAAIPSGTVGGLTYLSGAHTLATTAPASQTPTANTVPISNSSGTLNSWITGAGVTTALGYTPLSGSGITGGIARYTGSNTLASSFGISATPGTASVAAVSDGSGTLNGWVTHASGDVIQGATGVAGALALFSGAQTIGPSFGISATPGTASVAAVSDVSGTLNGWVTKHVQSTTTYTGPPSDWSTSGSSPLTVIGQGVSASSSTGSLSIAAITNVSTNATLNSCAVTLYVNGAQVGVQSVSNAGVAAVPSAGTATFSGGGYMIAVTITSINGAYSCGTQAGLTQIIVTEYSN